MNLFLVVTSSQFHKTKRKEAERRKKLNESLQNKENSEEGSCWEEFLKCLGDLIQKGFKKIVKLCKNNDNKIQVNYFFHSNVLNCIFLKLIFSENRMYEFEI
jgi:hypothetical protein